MLAIKQSLADFVEIVDTRLLLPLSGYSTVNSTNVVQGLQVLAY